MKRSITVLPSIGEYALIRTARFGVTFATLFERPTPLEDGEQGLQTGSKCLE